MKLKVPEQLKSRKFWMALVAALVVFLNKFLDWNLKETDVVLIVGALLGWVGVEGYVDGKRAEQL